MPAVIWELEVAGTRRTLAEWGLQDVSLRRANLAADTLQCTRPVLFDATPLCAYRAEVALFRDGVCWFRGQRILGPAEASGLAESQTYTFVGPWAWLERNVMRNVWFTGSIETSHIITYGQVGAIIQSVLNYAIAKGAPLTYVAADLAAIAVVPPSNESTGKLCSSVILDGLQFAPDVVAWFDYTTATPTLRFQRRAALTAAGVRTAADGTNEAQGPVVDVLRIVPRPDFQVPRVHLIFETISSEDGQQRLSYREEVAPSGAAFADGELSDVVIVQGRNVTTVEGTLEAETIVADETAAGIEWFKKHIETLNDPRVKILRLVPGSITREGWDGTASLGYLRELLEGQAEEWMELEDGTPIAWQKEVFRVKFDLEVYEDETQADATKLEGQNAAEFVFELVSTNAPDGESVYSTQETVEEAEAQPLGLAQYLYDSLSQLQYDAGFKLVEADCSGRVNLGHVVNLHGSLAEYAAMRAVVQEVTFEIDTGTTAIVCGPPRVLSINDILAVLKANRTRRRWTLIASQSSGDLSSSGRVTLGRGIANNNTIPGKKAREYFATSSDESKISLDSAAGELVVADKATPTTIYIKQNVQSGLFEMVDDEGRSIRLQLSDCMGGNPPTAKSLAVIEIPICVGSDNNWRRLIVGSAPYRPT